MSNRWFTRATDTSLICRATLAGDNTAYDTAQSIPPLVHAERDHVSDMVRALARPTTPQVAFRWPTYGEGLAHVAAVLAAHPDLTPSDVSEVIFGLPDIPPWRCGLPAFAVF